MKLISPIAIEHLLKVTADGFFVITADKPQKVARISPDGTLTEICPFDSRWVAEMTTHAFSPKGDDLALAILTAKQDFHEEHTLVVCDLKTNKVIFSDANVPLGPNMFSGRSNFLDLTWRTDEILQYCGPFTTQERKSRSQVALIKMESARPDSHFCHKEFWAMRDCRRPAWEPCGDRIPFERSG